MKRPLKTILADIADNAETMARDLDALPPSVRPGHQGAIRRAQEAAPALLQEYREAVLANSLAFFVSGGADGAPMQFAEIAYDEGALPADFGAMYAALADQLGPLMGKSVDFGMDQVVRLDFLLRGIATTSGFGRAVDLPRTAATYAVKGKRALTDHIRKLAETTTDGAKLNLLVTTKKLIEAAVSHRFARKTFKVVVINASAADRKLLEALFTRSVTVDLTDVETIDVGFVVGAFKRAHNETPPAPPECAAASSQRNNVGAFAIGSVNQQRNEPSNGEMNEQRFRYPQVRQFRR